MSILYNAAVGRTLQESEHCSCAPLPATAVDENSGEPKLGSCTRCKEHHAVINTPCWCLPSGRTSHDGDSWGSGALNVQMLKLLHPLLKSMMEQNVGCSTYHDIDRCALSMFAKGAIGLLGGTALKIWKRWPRKRSMLSTSTAQFMMSPTATEQY